MFKMLKEELKSILKELNSHHRDKSYLIENYIEERLNKSIEVYYKSLIESCNSILNTYKNDFKTMKKVISNL